MRRDLLGWAAAGVVLLSSFASWAQGSRQEESRRALENRLGVRKHPTDAGHPNVLDPVALPENAAADPEKAGPTPKRQPQPRGATYVDEARPVLERRCAGCHTPGGKAGSSGWVFHDDARLGYDATLSWVSLASPALSRLLLKTRGEAMHGGGKVLEPKSPEYLTLLQWIEDGARFGNKPAGPATAVAPPPALPAPVRPPPPSPPSESELAAVPEVSSEVAEKESAVTFASGLHLPLTAACGGCHAPGKPAGNSRYLVSADPPAHYAAVRALVVPGSPDDSVFWLRTRGAGHPPGPIWPAGSHELANLASWIEDGALGPPQPLASASPPVADTRGPAPAAPKPPHPPGLSLVTLPVLGSLRLNGRFDLNYERLGYTDNPFQAGATNALRSYHHFLFLTRESADDPVTITVEALSLQFWEVSYRLHRETWPVRLSAKLGKILVPFGAEPLFHHSYGGLAGFDQRVLPPVFSREGVAFNLEGRWRKLALSADLYLIAGYALKTADGALSLQSDFAPLEKTRPGAGARLGAALGPVSLWYSPYVNALGFGRTLFLQALDVAVWRPRGVAVLEHFSLGAGLLRADVSGGAEQGYGGPGADYYHFASYLQLRYYPRDWLYFQYRQGLRTFTNRRGVYVDETDLTVDDGSAHNVGVVARWSGLSVGLFHFWNLEKADELPNDFTRLMVAYDF